MNHKSKETNHCEAYRIVNNQVLLVFIYLFIYYNVTNGYLVGIILGYDLFSLKKKLIKTTRRYCLKENCKSKGTLLNPCW